MNKKEIITNNAQETIAFGKKLAENLFPNSVIALIGDLGSGKTTLTKGIAYGLGVKNPEYVNSPTFVIIREYKGRINLYHMDLYRLDKLLEIGELGLDEYCSKGGVVVIEWAQKAEKLLAMDYLVIELEILDNDKRQIKLNAIGRQYERVVESV